MPVKEEIEIRNIKKRIIIVLNGIIINILQYNFICFHFFEDTEPLEILSNPLAYPIIVIHALITVISLVYLINKIANYQIRIDKLKLKIEEKHLKKIVNEVF